MSWTRQQKLDALLRLPWTVRVEQDEEEGYFIARVIEIPSALATADSREELEGELWDSLRASLEVYLDHGDDIPLPPSVEVLPWEQQPFRQAGALKATYRPGEALISTNDETAMSRQIVEEQAA
jgi:predicted RNase H-like HicB family nuclease